MGAILRNGIVVSDKGPIFEGALAFEGDRILGVGSASDISNRFRGFEDIDVGNCIVMPGFVNAHTHTAMCLLRGSAEDMSLHDWLEKRIWPLESHLTPRDIEIGALLGAYEALLSGTTTLNSQYFYSPQGSEVHAFAKSGIRAIVGHGFFEQTREEGLRLTSEMAKKWHGSENGRIRISVDPHSAYSTGPGAYKDAHELMLELNDQLGDKGQVLLHTHVAESPAEANMVRSNFNVHFDGGVVNYLHNLGVLSENMLAVHAVHVSDEEIALLGKANVAVALNPVSNLKVGMGVAPYVRLKAGGIQVGLGTDGAASNNTLDMFESLKLLPLLQKGLSGNAASVPAIEAFETATFGGAKALKWNDEIGLIREGYKADIVVLDTSNMHSQPLYNVYSHLVYSARSSDVRHVFVNGRQLVKDGRIVGLDYTGFLKDVKRTKEALLNRAGAPQAI